MDSALEFLNLALLNNKMELAPNRCTQSKYFALQTYPQIWRWVSEINIFDCVHQLSAIAILLLKRTNFNNQREDSMKVIEIFFLFVFY